MITKEHINQRLIDVGKPNIQMIEPYVNAKHKSKFRCNCGFEWLTCTDKILNPSRGRCPRCYIRGSSQRLRIDTILDRLSKRGLTMVGEYVNAKTKTLFRCSSGHTWESIPDNVLKKRNPTGCPECFSNSDRTTLSLIDVEDRLSNRGIKIIEDFKGWSKKTRLECREGHIWEGVPRSIKKGCPRCAEYGFNPEKSAWEYGFIRDDYLKFGITNNLEQRLSTHRRYGDIELVHVRHHQQGHLAIEWERRIKQTFGGHFVTKEQCPDGWTETLPVYLLEEIKK